MVTGPSSGTEIDTYKFRYKLIFIATTLIFFALLDTPAYVC